SLSSLSFQCTSCPIPPSLPRVPWARGSPRSQVLCETTTAFSPSRSLRLSLAHPVPCVSLSSLADLRGNTCQRLGLLESAGGPLLPAICHREKEGSPKFPSYPF